MSIITRKGASLRAPREPLAALVGRVDMCSLVEQYTDRRSSSGGTVTFRCPNHEAHAHGDRTPSFVVNTRTGRAKCFGPCGFSGDALAFVMWREGLDVAEGARRLRAFLGEWEESPAPFTRPRSSSPVRSERRGRISEESGRAIPAEVRERTLRGYCRERGWPLSVVEDFGLDVVRDSFGKLRVRHNYFGPNESGEYETTWYQDRRLPLHDENVKGPKWLSTSGVAAYPYNLRSLERNHLDAVVITEGPADCVTAALALDGFGGIAVIGVPGANAWRPEWTRLLEGLRVIICRDSDEGGTRFLESVSNHLPEGGRVVTPTTKDLTEEALTHGLDAVTKLFEAALQGLDPWPRVEALILESFPGSFFSEEVTR